MKTTYLFKILAISAFVIVVLSAFSEELKGQNTPTAGGSVVLAKCNSWVSYMINKDCAYTKIECIGRRGKDKARVDITLGSSTQSYQIDQGSSITQGTALSATTIIKIVNIEKGLGGKQCDSRGPGDSDVRVYIPANVTNIQWGNLPTEHKCSVCGVNFDPIAQ
jgi:hypothetical protein